ncbi:MAG: SDR family NAD(P)-dependent oxidoreductase, partial [Streptosporangiaceae bacterium]|nr:SDR family NAD(P)-dependent oxidoreductase [Streptosporangiaceae bacterium]
TVTLVQALADDAGLTPGARLWSLTSGAVSGADTAPIRNVIQAQLWGFGRVAAVEHPDRWGGMVDLPDQLDENAWNQVAAAVTNPNGEDQLAVRTNGLFTFRLIQEAPDQTTERPWNPEGTVLIAGGTGALGAHVARWLAGRGTRRLLLVSRRGPEADGAAQLSAQLSDLGTHASIVSCDVTNRVALGDVLASIPVEHPLTAVVHAAGVLHDGMIGSLTPKRMADVLRAKTVAAANLHELTKDRDLGGFVLFSSMAGSLGGPGQASYAAANAYLDALAEYRREHGHAGVAIGWGPWDGEGLAVSSPEARRILNRAGTIPMPPQLAIQALGEIIDQGKQSALVADIDWSRVLAMAESVRSSMAISEIPEVRRIRQAEARRAESATALLERIARLSEAQRKRTILALIKTHCSAVLGHREKDLIVSERSFRELGFDSAGAVEFRNRLIRTTGLSLPATLAFDYPTPAVLADFIDQQLPRADRSGDETAPHLAQLREAVSALDPSDPRRADLSAQLRSILNLLNQDTAAGRDVEATQLDTATDKEMFDFIDKEFGIN